MADDPTAGTILVPVANEETARRQLETAVDLARDRSARICFCFVLTVPPQLSLVDGRDYLLEDEDERMLETAVELAEERGVQATSRIRIARTVASGVVGTAEAVDADLILVGWRGRPPREAVVLGSHVDDVLRDASCDVLVERIRTPRPDVERVLVPVVGGPHDELATETAASVARTRDASVTLLHVYAPSDADLEPTEAELRLAAARAAFDDVPTVERKLVEATDVAGRITDETTDHDLTLLGRTRGGLLQRTLLGSVSEAVARHAAGSVIIAKRYDPVPSRLRRTLSERFGTFRPRESRAEGRR